MKGKGVHADESQTPRTPATCISNPEPYPIRGMIDAARQGCGFWKDGEKFENETVRCTFWGRVDAQTFGFCVSPRLLCISLPWSFAHHRSRKDYYSYHCYHRMIGQLGAQQGSRYYCTAIAQLDHCFLAHSFHRRATERTILRQVITTGVAVARRIVNQASGCSCTTQYTETSDAPTRSLSASRAHCIPSIASPHFLDRYSSFGAKKQSKKTCWSRKLDRL